MRLEYKDILEKKLEYGLDPDKVYRKRFNFHTLTRYGKKYCGCCGKLLSECNCDIKKRDELKEWYKYKTKAVYPYNSAYHIEIKSVDNNLLVRYFVINVDEKIGKQYKIWCKEVMRFLITEKGKVYFSRIETYSMFSNWDFKYETELVMRNKIPEKYLIPITHNQIQKASDRPAWLKYLDIKNLWKVNEEITTNNHYGSLSLIQYIKTFIQKPVIVETMLKCKRYDLLAFTINKGHEEEMMMLLKKDKKIPSEWWTYRDYLDGLHTLEKDTKNIKVLVPDDFVSANARIEKACKKIRDKNELLLNIRKYNDKYINRVSKLLGVVFGNDKYIFSILPDIQAFWDEADSMCHCVYRMAYYNKDNSFIFSVRNKEDNKRLETAELKLDDKNNLFVSQCYGYGDQFTNHHNSIVHLLNNNLDNIKGALGI